MTYSFTNTSTVSFTITEARRLASKVVTDMTRCSQIYGRPTLQEVQDFGNELTLLLKDGYVSSYEFGFQKDARRLVSWSYNVDVNGAIVDDARPGGILAGIDVSCALYFNHLIKSVKWSGLTGAEQAQVNGTLPFVRLNGNGPQDGLGFWETDRSYSAGGVALSRRTFRPLK
jgi:hypothetical protein